MKKTAVVAFVSLLLMRCLGQSNPQQQPETTGISSDLLSAASELKGVVEENESVVTAPLTEFFGVLRSYLGDIQGAVQEYKNSEEAERDKALVQEAAQELKTVVQDLAETPVVQEALPMQVEEKAAIPVVEEALPAVVPEIEVVEEVVPVVVPQEAPIVEVVETKKVLPKSGKGD